MNLKRMHKDFCWSDVRKSISICQQTPDEDDENQALVTVHMSPTLFLVDECGTPLMTKTVPTDGCIGEPESKITTARTPTSMDLNDLMDPLNREVPNINEVVGQKGVGEDHLVMWAAKLYLSDPRKPEDPNEDEFYDFLWRPKPIIEPDRFEHVMVLLNIVGINTVQQLLDIEKDLVGDHVEITLQQITRNMILAYLEEIQDLVIKCAETIRMERAADALRNRRYARRKTNPAPLPKR